MLCSMGRICSIAHGGLLLLPMQSVVPSLLIPHKPHNLNVQLNRHSSTSPCYKLSIQGFSSSSSYSSSYVGFRTGGIFNKENAFTRSRTIRAGGGKSIAVVLSAISVPVLLVLVTVIVSIIVSEKLDRDFEDEIARRRTWSKRRGIQEDILDDAKEETDRVLSAARNRPKREE